MSTTFSTDHLQGCLARLRAGDREAPNELLRATYDRLEKLARRMTRSFPNVRPDADTGDVLHNSTLRLLRSLQTMRPQTTRDFFNLAAVHIRRELLDIARRCQRRVHHPWAGSATGDGEPAAPAAADFDLWVRFHEAVDQLPPQEREVMGLVFYHGWTQARIAALLGVDERTVRRWWARACKRLRNLVGDDRL
ncbi:MAG: sigma-70 family RNA polymerase sigma factor [Gemmataceae bacterium]|nr:sigma-70 family RNA polymerase sigma factor [Gemmataceae bacterium]